MSGQQGKERTELNLHPVNRKRARLEAEGFCSPLGERRMVLAGRGDNGDGEQEDLAPAMRSHLLGL